MADRDARPLLAITLGDPAGIGPEIILKALAHADLFERCRPLVIGDRRMLERAAPWVGQLMPVFASIASSRAGRYQPGTVTVLEAGITDPADVPIGVESAAGGRAAVEAVFAACDLTMAGETDAIVTAPLNKAAMHLAGFRYPGHTELLAERTGAAKITMLLTGPNLRIVHVSMHVGLAEAIARVTTERVLDTIRLAAEACRALGIAQPRIAVAGLNPHASEGGLFGDHEAEQIVPAIAAARAEGLDVSNPQPPDTVFLRATAGAYDIVVAMYHDQGHIPMKLLAFDSGVNVSIGLPIIRTSVDHGTAFDIAGTGVAREESLLAAIDVAIQMVAARRSSTG
ncbi:MAG: 4-hydroxythreonine-4-phosphate dehydrogenase PdxA [Chloroflexota bacterium]|nr:4-hydroxythreonine-4-phosphate dehydrogenase PdxA [Chloroflexota bacterium]